MLTVVSSLALLAAAQSVSPEPSDEGSSLWQIGNSVATMRVCGALGYTIDQQGLADWATVRRDAVAKEDQALTGTEAQSQIEQASINHTARIYAIYWEGAIGGGRRSDEIIDKQYRFVNLYRKKCNRLALSPELGAFLTAPDKHPAASQVVADITREFKRAKLAP